MAKQIVREIERYDCEDDDGDLYVVVEYQHYTISEAMTRAPQEVPTIKECRLINGEHVKVIGDGVFEIVDTDTIIREI